jgi:hypothetical protein
MNYNQVQYVTSFQELVSTPFRGAINAICWTRDLNADFSEIADKLEITSNLMAIDEEELFTLQLSEQGKLAREILLKDLKQLKAHGASPALNLIKCYERDNTFPFFPTDVYSFHVDRSPVPTDTFLCTYCGEPSEILSNLQAVQKILIPEVCDELKKIYHGRDEGFESFLTEHFFDLHYLPKPEAKPISLGLGNLWRLAVDHPESNVLPCIHRAPQEKNGQARLMMIC